MNSYHAISNPAEQTTIVWLADDSPVEGGNASPGPKVNPFLKQVRLWLNGIDIRDRKIAHWICRLIPTSCPFERRITVKGRTLLYIPPLCKLNPCYEEVMGLRFRALCFLADTCQEDVSRYC